MDRRLRIVRRIGPSAIGRQGECAKAICARRRCLRDKHRLTRIRIRDAQLASGGQGRLIFGHRTGADPADHRRVVHPGDRHGHDLCGAIRRDSGKAVGRGLPRFQALDRRLRIVRLIGPSAIGRQGECAKAICAEGGLRLKHRLTRIRIRDTQLASGGLIFGHRTGADPADHRIGTLGLGVFTALRPAQAQGSRTPPKQQQKPNQTVRQTAPIGRRNQL